MNKNSPLSVICKEETKRFFHKKKIFELFKQIQKNQRNVMLVFDLHNILNYCNSFRPTYFLNKKVMFFRINFPYPSVILIVR
jgi:thioredoxin-related protein